MKLEGNGDIYCNRRAWNGPQRLGNWVGEELEIRGRIATRPEGTCCDSASIERSSGNAGV